MSLILSPNFFFHPKYGKKVFGVRVCIITMFNFFLLHNFLLSHSTEKSSSTPFFFSNIKKLGETK